MKKKAIIIISTVLGILLLGGGIVFAVMRTTGKEVKVIPVSGIAGGYWGSNVDISGVVTSNASQEVHLTDKEIVQEVFVKEGDTVQVGSPLLSFDTTMTSLNLESEKLNKEALQIKKNALEKEISRLKKKTPVKKTAHEGNTGSMQFMTAVTKGPRLLPLATEEAIQYEITFKDWDGTELSKATYEKGAAIAVPEDPSRGEDDQYTYAFQGWDPEVVPTAEADAIYTAVYQETPIEPEPSVTPESYEIIFKNWDGTELSKETYEQGTPITVPKEPSREEDDQYTYAFQGWDPEVVPTADADAAYTAVYAETPKKVSEYEIAFVDWDGRDISRVTYEKGAPITVPEDPIRKPDEKYTYFFKGWDVPVVLTAEGTATYTATYYSPIAELTMENYKMACYKGAGDQADPQFFLGNWDGKNYYVGMRGDFLNGVRENGTCFWIQLFDNNDITDLLRGAIYIDGSTLGEYEDDKTYVANLQPVDNGEDQPSPDFPEYPGGDNEYENFNDGEVLPPEGVTEGYTKEELDKLISEKKKELKTVNLDIRQSDLKIAQVQKSLDNQEVKSTVIGVVKSVGDPEKGEINGKPFLVVESTEGLFVQGTLSELMLGDIKEGQMLQGTSYETGIAFEAEIREISTYPADSQGGYGGGNNASYYPFTAFIAGGTGLKNNESVGFTATVGDDVQGDALYIQKAFVREEEGKSYVYAVGEKNRLERREIETGRSVDGYTVEVKSGLTNEDLIAFPYGKDVKAGAKTREVSMEEFYM